MWTLTATQQCEMDCEPVCLSVFVGVFMYIHAGKTHWRWEGKTNLDYSFFTMRAPTGVATVSCLCPLVVFLCVVSQSCYGTQVNLRPHANPKPSLYPNPKLKSLPEPTLNPRSSPDKHMMPLKPSQLSSSNQNLWVKSRLDTMSYSTDNHRSKTNFPLATTSSNSKLKLQHAPKQSSNSRQELAYRSTSNQVARNNSKQSFKINTKSNPKPRLGSLSQPRSNIFSNSRIVTRPETHSESVSNNKLSLLSSLDQKSNSSVTMNLSTFFNTSLASLSNTKSHSKLQPSSQINTNAKPNSRTSIRAQRNQTKLLDTDKDSQYRPKRGWIWNQFFVLEEHIGPEPQYVGKVSYSVFVFSSSKDEWEWMIAQSYPLSQTMGNLATSWV